MLNDSLRITEIFLSLQGEGAFCGYPTVFVRLTGCPLRCTYCDSEYAFYGGEKQLMSDIYAQIEHYGVPHVCVTGGEPLAQPGSIPLLTELCNRGYSVSLETSGALSTEAVDPRVSVVLDLKTPSSGEQQKNDYSNISRLQRHDQVKFVIGNRDDYQWSAFLLSQHKLCQKVDTVLFSPVYGVQAPVELANWIVEDKLPVRFQIQLHKTLWGDIPGT